MVVVGTRSWSLAIGGPLEAFGLTERGSFLRMVAPLDFVVARRRVEDELFVESFLFSGK